MDKKRILLNSQKTIINDQLDNRLFMEIDILLLKNDVNLNDFIFTEAFIDEIVNNQAKYVGLPLVVDLEKLLSKDYLNLHHNYSVDIDKFYTEQIGSFIRFEKKYGEDGVAELHGTARVSKRNADLVDALLNLYNSPIGLNFSVEVLASKYVIREDGVVVIDAHPDNLLMSDALVSFPAEPDSRALKLIAELNNALKPTGQNGDVQMNKNYALYELSHDDIRSQIFALLNPNLDEYGYRIIEYWVIAVYDGYAIIEDEKTPGVYYKIEYTIEDDIVSLGEKVRVEIEYTPVNDDEGGNPMNKANVNVNELIDENKKLTLEIEKLKGKVGEIDKLTNEKADLEKKLNEANETIVSLGNEKETMKAELEELRKFKKEVEEKQSKAEIEAIINEVKETLTDEEIKSLNELAETLDVEKVRFKVNELCAKKFIDSIKLNNSKDGKQFFAVASQEDLFDDDLSKYNM